MSPEATVTTPIWSCGDRDHYERDIAGAADLFGAWGAPTLNVLKSLDAPDGSGVVSWVLSVEWPGPWRPRANILGESVVSVDGDGKVLGVSETWHQTPVQAFVSQVLPKLRDIGALWATPTAEHVPMPVAGEGKGYDLRLMPPLTCLQAEWTESGDMLSMEQAPLAPHFAFTGEVKRTEWYSAVSPGMVERSVTQIKLPGGMAKPGQRRRWIMPLPQRYAAYDIADMPEADGGSDDDESLPGEVSGASCQYVRRPAQLIAVAKVKGGDPSNKNVLGGALELAQAVERSGKKVVRSGGQPVVLQMSHDLKYGFNEKRQLAMCIWLSVPWYLRTDEVAVYIDES